MKNIFLIVFLIIILGIFLFNPSFNSYNTSPLITINKFQKGLENGNVEQIVDTYCDDPLNPPRIITNVPTIFIDKVWPWTGKFTGTIPVGSVITGLDELRAYQTSVFKNFSFHNLTSKVISLDIGEKSAVAVIYGTHVIKGKLHTKHAGEIKYTQAQELWHLVRCSKKGWCVKNVGFIDKVRT